MELLGSTDAEQLKTLGFRAEGESTFIYGEAYSGMTIAMSADRRQVLRAEWECGVDQCPRPRRPLWLIAGPNGVGKTTYAFRHIRAVAGTARFVNLDEIARGLSPLNPEAEGRRAARVALDLMRALMDEKRSFSLETTLAGRTHLQTIERVRSAGCATTLLFYIVHSPEICLARIARRVSEGGHDVPEADVHRRFERAVRNLQDYVEAVDLWRVLDNNGRRPAVVAEGRQGCVAMLGGTEGLPPPLATALDELPPSPRLEPCRL